MQMLNFTNSCYLRAENNIYMTKNAITWIREDFRVDHNPALSYASQNHENVIALYIYNKADFDNKREAQKWWLFKSLEIFKLNLIFDKNIFYFFSFSNYIRLINFVPIYRNIIFFF